jgi:WD40 repeat protein
VQSVAFVQGDRLLAAASKDGTLRVWDVETGLLTRVLGNPDGRVYALACSPRDDVLATADASGAIRLWDLRDWPRGTVFEAVTPAARLMFDPVEDRLLVVQGGRPLSASPSRLPVPSVFPEILTKSSLPIQWRLESEATREIALVRFGAGVVFGPTTRTLALADVDTGQIQSLLPCDAPESPVESICASSKGEIIAAGSKDGYLHLWNAVNQTVLARVAVSPGALNRVVFSPDDALILCVGGQQLVSVYQMATGTLEKFDEDQNIILYAAAFSPDGKWAVTGGSDRQITVWTTQPFAKFKVLHSLPTAVNALAFSPDGRTLVSAGTDGTVRFCNVATWQEMFAVKLRMANVDSLAFSPDQHLLAVTMVNEPARLSKAGYLGELELISGGRGAGR